MPCNTVIAHFANILSEVFVPARQYIVAKLLDPHEEHLI